MKEFFREIRGDKVIAFALFTNLLFLVAATAFILLSYSKLPPFVPVFNQLPWGEQRLGDQITMFIPILAALLILITNLFIGAVIYKKIPLISRMLAAISLLTGLLTLLFVVKTILLIS